MSNLPPSVDSREERRRASDPKYEVSYSISVTGYAGESTLATAVHKIFVDQALPESLTNRSNDIGGECVWAERSRLKRFKRTGSTSTRPRIELAGQEPPAIVLHADDVTTEGGTEIPFVVKLIPRDGSVLIDNAFPKDCAVKAQLVTKTHVTPDGSRATTSGISLDSIINHSMTTTKTQYSHQQYHEIPISTWERSVISESSFVVCFCSTRN